MKQKKNIVPNIKGLCACEQPATISVTDQSMNYEYSIRQKNGENILIIINAQNVGTHLNRGKVVMLLTVLVIVFGDVCVLQR